jgi:hypothetical protein
MRTSKEIRQKMELMTGWPEGERGREVLKEFLDGASQEDKDVLRWLATVVESTWVAIEENQSFIQGNLAEALMLVWVLGRDDIVKSVINTPWTIRNASKLATISESFGFNVPDTDIVRACLSNDAIALVKAERKERNSNV